jgi:hypothetical protein
MAVCPLCKNLSKNESVYDSADIPLSRYGLLDSENDFVARVSVKLMYCERCDFGWNEDYDEINVNYQSNQIIEANRFSEAYRAHFQNSTKKISKYLTIADSRLVEIGAGACDFLEMFEEAKERHAIEPSHEIRFNNNPNIHKHNEYFKPGSKVIPADLIIMRQVLEHIPNPRLFILEVLNAFKSNRPETSMYLEVPNSELTFTQGRFQDIYYDHCNYFTTQSIVKLADLVGLQVCDISTEKNNEIISVFLKTKSAGNLQIEQKFSEAISDIQEKIREARSDQREVLVWGAAGNGVTLLNVLKLFSSEIKYVIDKDVNKQGKYVPVTGQKIISPGFAKTLNVSAIIVASQFHRQEIEAECFELFGGEVRII